MTPDGETELFDIIAGVLQGNTLTPYLFAIVIDYVMRQAVGNKAEELGFRIEIRKSRRIPPKIITDLMFADDIALVSEEIEQAQELLLKKKLKKWDSSSIPKRLKLCNTVIKALSRSLLKMGKTPKKS